MADIETGYWIDRETAEILLPEQQEYQEQELGRKRRRALSQPSPCRQGPRFRPSLNYNRRLQASQAHQLDGRPLLASPPSIFRTTAPTFFHLLSSLCKSYLKCKRLQKVQDFRKNRFSVLLSFWWRIWTITEPGHSTVTLYVIYADAE